MPTSVKNLDPAMGDGWRVARDRSIMRLAFRLLPVEATGTQGGQNSFGIDAASPKPERLVQPSAYLAHDRFGHLTNRVVQT